MLEAALLVSTGGTTASRTSRAAWRKNRINKTNPIACTYDWLPKK
jgi:hypothetical protein